jgi:phosphopantetheinyl transferase
MVRPVREAGSIVKRYFHPDEAMAWHTVAPGLREEAFFVLWSAREASMKCAGLGLARGLSVTRVDPAILADRQAAARVGDTRMDIRRLDAPNGYVAVVAQAAL